MLLRRFRQRLHVEDNPDDHHVVQRVNQRDGNSHVMIARTSPGNADVAYNSALYPTSPRWRRRLRPSSSLSGQAAMACGYLFGIPMGGGQ